jgi:hypothetical protein
MRMKSEIENQLAHFKAGCTADPAVNATWIQALEWVLGDAAHQQAYAEWIRTIEPLPARTDAPTPSELILKHSLLQALGRLR